MWHAQSESSTMGESYIKRASSFAGAHYRCALPVYMQTRRYAAPKGVGVSSTITSKDKELLILDFSNYIALLITKNGPFRDRCVVIIVILLTSLKGVSTA